MPLPLPFDRVYQNRNQTMNKYGSDSRGLVTYYFNNYGYRNNIDYSEIDTNVGVYIGSSLTSGIGICWEDSFAHISASDLNVKCYQFSQGCMPLDNQEMVKITRTILESSLDPEYFVIQFIDLNRRYDPVTGKFESVLDETENINLFINTFNEMESLLANKKWVFIGCDANDHAVPESIKKHPNCVKWNPLALDRAGVGCHMGMRWHFMTGKGIANLLKKIC